LSFVTVDVDPHAGQLGEAAAEADWELAGVEM
jgi:hypothetical protein